MRSLVVEDEFTARSILQRFLAHYGSCDVAVHGEEAIAAVKEGLLEEISYDLVCLDIGLPGLNGQSVLDEIRALEQQRGVLLGQGCRVIMTTASTAKNHVLGAFRGGADAYLTKPISLPALSQELRRLRLLD